MLREVILKEVIDNCLREFYQLEDLSLLNDYEKAFTDMSNAIAIWVSSDAEKRIVNVGKNPFQQTFNILDEVKAMGFEL